MTPPKHVIECPETGEGVDVRSLLFGLHPTTFDDVLDVLRKTATESPEQHAELLILLQREFASRFRQEQSKIDSHCPHIFVLRPLLTGTWKDVLFGAKMELQLYCQAPGCWHPTAAGGNYIIEDPLKWLQKTGPYIQKMAAFLEFVSPSIGPWLPMAAPDYEKLIKQDIKSMNELLAELLPESAQEEELGLAEALGETTEGRLFRARALRAVRQLLDMKDPSRHWGALKKVLTPEGHYIWLCEFHAKAFA
jgi:hypothetical protein